MAVRAIRGATQVDADDREQVLEATRELVTAVLERNDLAHVGLPVSRLTRTAVGPIELRAMRSGTIRKLSREELGSLQELVGL